MRNWIILMATGWLAALAPGAAAQSWRTSPPELGWSPWLWERARYCVNGLRRVSADQLAATLDGGKTVAAAEAELDALIERETTKAASCLIRLRDVPPTGVLWDAAAGKYATPPDYVITDARRAEINSALGKLDAAFRTMANNAKAGLRAQSGTYFAKHVQGPCYFTEAIAAYDFLLANRRSFTDVCGAVPAEPPLSTPTTGPDFAATPLGRYAICASIYANFPLPFEPNFAQALAAIGEYGKAAPYRCSGAPPGPCFPGQAWGKLLNDAVRDAYPATEPHGRTGVQTRFSGNKAPLILTFNRHQQVMTSYSVLFCSTGQSTNCISPTLVSQANKIGTSEDRNAISRVVNAYVSSINATQPAFVAVKQWQDRAMAATRPAKP
jgi:hypothetical protein